MADVTITAANVIKGANAVTEPGIAGATITAGQVVYKDTTDSNKFKLADSDNATAAIRTPYGIALNSASAGQPVVVQTGGLITIGGTLTAGTIYTASDTAGGLRPAVDNNSGDTITIIGVATSASVLNMNIFASGAVL